MLLHDASSVLARDPSCIRVNYFSIEKTSLTSCSDPRRFDPSIDRSRMEQLLLLEYYIPFIIGAYILVDALDDAYRANDLYAIFHKNYRNMFAQTGYQRFSLVSFIVCAQRGLSIIGQNLEGDWNGMGFSVEMFGCSRRLLWTVL